jgi:DNA-directed RNA polymerase subunit E'/Rpb7
MEQPVLFEHKVALTPKDMNRISTDSFDTIILEQLSKNLDGRCNQHGFIIPGSLEIVSRSMGSLEHGRYTGNVVFHVQVQGRVYNPVNGTRVTGKIDKKNNMGVYIIYNDAVRILVPRDLHLGNQAFESLQPGQEINVEIRKSRFQIQDLFILSIGVIVDGDGVAVEMPVTATELPAEYEAVIPAEAPVDTPAPEAPVPEAPVPEAPAPEAPVTQRKPRVVRVKKPVDQPPEA